MSKVSMLAEVPHIVKRIWIGNGLVEIADNYCANKTPEEVKAALDRMVDIAQPNLVAAILAKMELDKNKGKEW